MKIFSKKTSSLHADVESSNKTSAKRVKRLKWWMKLQESEIYGHDYLPWLQRDNHSKR